MGAEAGPRLAAAFCRGMVYSRAKTDYFVVVVLESLSQTIGSSVKIAFYSLATIWTAWRNVERCGSSMSSQSGTINFGFKTEMSSQLKWRDCQRHLPQVASLRPMHYKCGPVNNVMYRAATGLILERCVGNSL